MTVENNEQSNGQERKQRRRWGRLGQEELVMLAKSEDAAVAKKAQEEIDRRLAEPSQPANVLEQGQAIAAATDTKRIVRKQQGATGMAAEIVRTCDAVKELLLAKNKAYGNSALDPVRVFSKSDPVEQLKVRIDDKLSRLLRGEGSLPDESLNDTITDLLGYFVLLKIALARRADAAPSATLNV